MRLVIVFFLGWMLLMHPQGCQADEAQPAGPEPSYNLAQVLEKTYTNNPTLRAARAELKAVHEDLAQAQANWRPTITADGSVVSTNNEGSNFGGAQGSTSKDIAFGFTQPLFRGLQTVSEVRAVRHAITAQRALLAALEQDIMLEAATAYMDIYRDNNLVDMRKNNRDVIATELDAYRKRFAVGDLTRTDVAQAQSRLAAAEAELVSAKGQLETSKGRFEQLTGLSAKKIDTDVKPLIDLPAAFEDIVSLAEEQSPDIHAAQALHKASQEDISEVFGELFPEIDLFGEWNRTLDPQPGIIEKSTSKSIGVSLSVPLYEGGDTRSRVRQAKHVSNQRFLEILEVKRKVRQDILVAWEALHTAEAAIISRESQVKAATTAWNGVSLEHRLGMRTVLDVLDARQELIEARAALVESRRDRGVARFRLAAAVGVLRPERLDFTGMEEEFDRHLRSVESKFFGMNVDILSLPSD